MALHFITGSEGKFSEGKRIIPQLVQVKMNLLEIQELDPKKIIEAKLHEAIKSNPSELIVEDTSLLFDGLNGLPGTLIKWFYDTIGNEGLFKMATATGNNHVIAKTLIGYHDGKGTIHYFEGILEGTIVSPRGEGFGWDAIFEPKGFSKTMGEMTREEKNEISMRGIAFQKLADYLNQNKLEKRLKDKS